MRGRALGPGQFVAACQSRPSGSRGGISLDHVHRSRSDVCGKVVQRGAPSWSRCGPSAAASLSGILGEARRDVTPRPGRTVFPDRDTHRSASNPAGGSTPGERVEPGERSKPGNRRRSSATGGDDPRATSRVEVRRTSGVVVPWGTAIASSRARVGNTDSRSDSVGTLGDPRPRIPRTTGQPVHRRPPVIARVPDVAAALVPGFQMAREFFGSSTQLPRTTEP
jgi:hypothetical protein